MILNNLWIYIYYYYYLFKKYDEIGLCFTIISVLILSIKSCAVLVLLVAFVYGNLVLFGSNPLFMVFFLNPYEKKNYVIKVFFFLDCTSLLQQQWRTCFGFVQLWKSLKDFHICTIDIILLLLLLTYHNLTSFSAFKFKCNMMSQNMLDQ